MLYTDTDTGRGCRWGVGARGRRRRLSHLTERCLGQLHREAVKGVGLPGRAVDTEEQVLGEMACRGCPCSALGSATLTLWAPWGSGSSAALQNSECPWPAAPALLSFLPHRFKTEMLNPFGPFIAPRPGVRSQRAARTSRTTPACSEPKGSPHPGARRLRDCSQLRPHGLDGAAQGHLTAGRCRAEDAASGHEPPPPPKHSTAGIPGPLGPRGAPEQRAAAGTRSQRQRGQGRLKQGSPHPTAVSGCLLGRRRAVRRGGAVPCPGRAVRRELGRGVLRVHLGVRGVQGGVVEQRVPHFHFSGLQSEMEARSGRSGPAAERVNPPCTALGPEPSGGTELRPGGPEPRWQQWGSSPRLRQLSLNGPVKT